MFPQSGGLKDLRSLEDIKERVLHWLSLDMQVRALAERLLDRFAETVGDLPAKEDGNACDYSGGTGQRAPQYSDEAGQSAQAESVSVTGPAGGVSSSRSALSCDLPTTNCCTSRNAPAP